MNKQFIDLTEAAKSAHIPRKKTQGSVIKSSHLSKELPIRKVNKEHEDVKIAPIHDEQTNIVIGVKVHCLCGEVTEIYFQYDEPHMKRQVE